MSEITGGRARLITALIGDVAPATDSLVKSLAESVQNRREHEHPTHEDWFCVNQVSWAGERVAFLIRRLLDSEAELARARAELAEIKRPAPDGLTYFELRRGAEDDPTPLVLDQYAQLADATEHGLDDYHDEFGHADQLTWHPESDEDDAVIHLYATTDGEEVETEWHVVTRTVKASYDPDEEG